MRIANTIPESIVDGPGLRYVVFIQGCSHNCFGCHNPDTHDPNDGRDVEIADILTELLSNPIINGLTISGGEPFDQAKECAELAYFARYYKVNVWVYTGYRFEDLLRNHNPSVEQLLRCTDVLVDGPYIQTLKSYEARFRGSKNQRLINVPESLKKGEVVLWVDPRCGLEKFQTPES